MNKVELAGEIALLRSRCDQVADDRLNDRLDVSAWMQEVAAIVAAVQSLWSNIESVFPNDPPPAIQQDLVAIAEFLQGPVGLTLANKSDDLCPKCGKAKDDHLVKDLREHSIEFDQPHGFTAPDDSTIVVLGEDPEEAVGVVVMSIVRDATKDPRPTLIFRFKKSDGSNFPDRAYTASEKEMNNLSNIIRDAVDMAVAAAGSMQPKN